jgi:uncharacterized glyoxalase superfamily protein PhnB
LALRNPALEDPHQTLGELLDSLIEPIFAKLSAGGTVNTPLIEEYFGTFGDLTDKFGIGWFFQAGGNANA